MERQPIPLRECVREWQAYKASIEGKPAPFAEEMPAHEVYEAFGRTVAQEMMDDPVFFRLVMGKLAPRLFGPL
jgi:hypothetical protein